MPDTRNKRTAAMKAADADFIEDMVLRGGRARGIAVALGRVRDYTLSRQQIQIDINKLSKAWLDSAVATVDLIRKKELAGLDLQEEELWAAWEKSKADAIIQRVERSGPADAPLAEGPQDAARAAEKKSVTREGQHGDSNYMRLILEVRDRRARLLGLNAATRTELTGAEGEPIAVAPFPEVVVVLNGERQTYPERDETHTPPHEAP